ncbi:putative WRKY transcription factor 41 [Acorus calamus]|uniref:WRKY transcription factor 41 n=1 Tax=Acorus calamus TaxID=4465 RepID=A0AAV9CD41_ACOCL|nr:putative WRKY transcription factor 41 [Acorus calamus]
MEFSGESNQQPPLVCKLMQGRDLARRLETQLEPSEQRRSLLQQLIMSIEDALLMARVGEGAESTPPPRPPAVAVAVVAGVGSESPQSMSGSDHNSDQATQNCGERREASKKRKTQPKWTNQVRVYSGNGLEAPLDDGYSWRKYGQKDILGATYPRGYYRCTHRSTRDCPATKLVQRSDDHPSIFDITYRGTHTCQSNQSLTPTSSPRPQNNHNHQQQPPPPQHLLLNFRTGLRVKTEDLDGHDGPPLSSTSFSFPPTPIDLPLKPENHIFSSHSPTMLTESHANFIGGASGFSSPFISPATSESNYFSVSPCMGSFGGTMESDFTEIISAATSTTNSPLIDLDFHSIFPFDQNFLS